MFAIVGRIRRSHGVKGDVLVEPFTGTPGALLAPGVPVFLGRSAGPDPLVHDAVVVETMEVRGDGLLLRIEGVSDRNAADLLRGRFLFVPIASLPAPAKDEVFLHDLVGMMVATDDGTDLGEVRGWFELPHGLLLEVRGVRGEILVPYHDEFVRHVDSGQRRLVVRLPEGYLD